MVSDFGQEKKKKVFKNRSALNFLLANPKDVCDIISNFCMLINNAR